MSWGLSCVHLVLVNYRVDGPGKFCGLCSRLLFGYLIFSILWGCASGSVTMNKLNYVLSSIVKWVAAIIAAAFLMQSVIMGFEKIPQHTSTLNES